ncbi:hypothetical protein ACQP04_33095 [Pseudonocardia halophobica]|uniref:hypothetical protein n=1 Tax=Pseudonocardia halophobica TaxID=29401 RepID=UPI003D89E468
MRMRWRAGLVMAAATALAAGGVAPAGASGGGSSTTWSADLASGEAAGVTDGGDGVRLDPATAFSAPVEQGGMTEDAAPTGAVPTGLLTLAPRDLDRPTSRVDSVVDGDLPPGTTASVDVRGRTPAGGWTEWIPATASGADSGSVTLPGSTSEVQGRLVLTGTVEGTAPTVRGVTLTAASAPATEGGLDLTEGAPFSANVFATREGLVGGTTSNGHVITERDHFVALPSRRALSPRDTSDYSVRVCAPNGRCAFAPVWDVGPWNTRDDYWNPAGERQEWKDLPRGVPQAQAAFRDGYNGGNDQFGRKLVNPAGIDLADGVFWDALGLKDNSQVQVDYLWTGSVRLSKVESDSEDGTAQVRSAPSDDAEVVGVAADTADVPVQCATGTGSDAWLRIGDGQFLSASVLPRVTDVPVCEDDADDADAGDAAAPGDSGDTADAGDPAAGAAATAGDGSANAGAAAVGAGAGAVGAGAGAVAAGAGAADAGAGAADAGAGAADASAGAADAGAGAGDGARGVAGPVGTPDPAAQDAASAEVGGSAAVRAGASTVDGDPRAVPTGSSPAPPVPTTGATTTAEAPRPASTPGD